MRQKGYLGVDLGGTGAKAGVFSRAGELLGFGRKAYAPAPSEDGHAEIPIDEIYMAARDAAAAAVRASSARVVAMAIASQGQTFVSLDAAGQPLHRAILWYDARAARCAELLGAALRKSAAGTPLPHIDAIAVAPKIAWLRERHPSVMAQAHRYLLLPDYLAYRLTGTAVTDPWTAGSTGLFAAGAQDYCPAALELAAISSDQLAVVRPAGAIVGQILPRTAREWGLEPGTVFVVGTNDQYAGALGAGNCRTGILSETTGTCLALVTLTEKAPEELPRGLFCGEFPVRGYHFVLAYSKTAGLVLDWFRREFCSHRSLDELNRMAAGVPIGSRGLTVLPHFDGLVSPRPCGAARGAVCGLGLQHTRADVYRAILESLCFSLRENLALLAENGFPVEVVRSIGGGARSDVLLQMKAEATGLAVERPVVTEAAVLGAAMIAAAGCGEFSSLAECSDMLYRCERVFTPDRSRHDLYEKPYRKYRELCATMYPEVEP